MNLTLRYATQADDALIADISRQTFYDTFAADNRKEDMDKFLSEQFTRGRLMLEVGQAENIFVLAFEGDAVAGYMKLRDGRKPALLASDSALELARLYVLKDYLGKGVGAALMQRCVDEARQKNKEWLWLGVWEKNSRAIAFYEKWGFEKFDEWDFLLGDDVQRDWLMKKNVTVDNR